MTLDESVTLLHVMQDDCDGEQVMVFDGTESWLCPICRKVLHVPGWRGLE